MTQMQKNKASLISNGIVTSTEVTKKFNKNFIELVSSERSQDIK